MPINKELLDLYQAYLKHLGAQRSEEAAQLTLAHVLIDIKRVLARGVKVFTSPLSTPEIYSEHRKD